MNRLIAIFGVLAFLVSCGPAQKEQQDLITVSILPQKYFVERIAGDRFEIHVLTPPGASPETYEPTPRQMKTLANSFLYFANGYLMFEDHLAEKLGKDLAMKTIDLSRGIDLIAGDIVDHGDHVHLYGIDPHYWLSPAEVRVQAINILDALVDADPENKDEYQANFDSFINDVRLLDGHISELLNDVSLRIFMIYHPAYAYFARAYNLEQIALEMDGKEPTASHMKYIVDLARTHGIKNVLVQSQFNEATAKVIADEIGAEVINVDPLPEDWLHEMYEMALVFHAILNP